MRFAIFITLVKTLDFDIKWQIWAVLLGRRVKVYKAPAEHPYHFFYNNNNNNDNNNNSNKNDKNNKNNK